MGGGSIAIRPFTDASTVPHGAGNACLYGATGGSLFVAGSVGQRFAVRNSGATAVVEATSDHLCEYMTGGAVVVLGPTVRNIAAGMTGGVLYLHDPQARTKGLLSGSAPAPKRLDSVEAHTLKGLVSEHLERTGSAKAAALLDDWESAVRNFWVLRPEAPEVTEAKVTDSIEISAAP